MVRYLKCAVVGKNFPVDQFSPSLAIMFIFSTGSLQFGVAVIVVNTVLNNFN